MGPEGPGGIAISPLRSLWTPITPFKRPLSGASSPLAWGPPLGCAHLRMRYAALIVLIPCAQRYALALRVYNVFGTLALLFKPQFVSYLSLRISIKEKRNIKDTAPLCCAFVIFACALYPIKM